MDIVILAGGRCSPELKTIAGTEFRASLPIWGTTMVEIVIEAVRNIGDPILVGGPPGMLDRQFEAGESFIGSLGNGLAQVRSDNFLLATADLPFLTEGSVRGFIELCDLQAMLNYPIIRAEKPDPRFGEMKRTTLKLKEGRFTGGNLGLMNTALMRKNLHVMERAYGARKKPLKLASIVGFGTLFRVIAGQIAPSLLSVHALERAVSRFLGGSVKAVITPFPEIGMDIDNAEQYSILCSLKNPLSPADD